MRAYEHWLRGKSLIYLMGQNILQARQHFERAIEVDPSYARAHSGLSQTYMWEALEFPLPGESRTIAWTKAAEHAHRAVMLDGTDDEAHLILGFSYLYSSRCELAKKHIDQALMLNPNAADTLANATYVLTALGEAELAIECAQTALRLNPHRPDWYITYLSFALFTAHRYSDALAFRVRAPDVFIDSRFVEAAILAHSGRIEEAKHSASVAMAKLAATPGGALAIAERRVVELLLANNPYCRREDRDHFAAGMRRAGIPG